MSSELFILDDESRDVLKLALSMLSETVNRIDDTFKLLDDLQSKVKSVPENMVNQLKAQAFDAIDTVLANFDLRLGTIL